MAGRWYQAEVQQPRFARLVHEEKQKGRGGHPEDVADDAVKERQHPAHTVHVHLLPARKRDDLRKLPEEARFGQFWDNLYQGDAWFAHHRRIPKVRVGWDGVYRFGT